MNIYVLATVSCLVWKKTWHIMKKGKCKFIMRLLSIYQEGSNVCNCRLLNAFSHQIYGRHKNTIKTRISNTLKYQKSVVLFKCLLMPYCRLFQRKRIHKLPNAKYKSKIILYCVAHQFMSTCQYKKRVHKLLNTAVQHCWTLLYRRQCGYNAS
jgi:hypothetical protein